MNIFHAYAKKSMQKNRTRTLVTIVGIILSASMLTAVISIITSIQAYGIAYESKECGNYHVKVSNLSKEECETLQEDARIGELCTLMNIGYAGLTDMSNPYKPYLYIGSADKAFLEHLPVNLTEGRMPEREGEILIPEHLIYNGGIDVSVGDTLPLRVGVREGEAGVPLWQEQSLDYSESEEGSLHVYEHLTDEKKQSYTVVGIYERPDFENYYAPGYTALTVRGENSPGSSADVWIVMKNPKDAIGFWREVSAEGEHLTQCNNSLLRFYGYSVNDRFHKILYGMGGILTAIIIIGSVALIYNAFAISIGERTKEFGIIASVGATKKQMKGTVLYEASVLCMLGIPIGILAGMGGIGVTLLYFEDTFYYLIGNVDGVTLKLSVTPAAIVLVAALGVLTVLLSAYLPVQRALSGSAIDAIRGRDERKLTKRKLNIPRFVTRHFGFEGMLAWKNFKRSRRKYRATIFSLALSVLLFVSGGAFLEYLFGSFYREVNFSGYDVWAQFYPDNYEDVLRVGEEMRALSDAELIYDYIYLKDFGLETSGDILTEEARQYRQSQEWIFCPVSFIPDAYFEQVADSYGLDVGKYFDAESPKALVLNRIVDDSVDDSGDAPDHRVLSMLNKDIKELPLYEAEYLGQGEMQEGETFYVSVGDVVENDITEEAEHSALSWHYAGGMYSIKLLYPVSMLPVLLENGVFADSECTGNYYFEAQDHVALEDELNSLFSDKSSAVYNRAVEEERIRMMLLMINVFGVGFITLISLIAAANIFNTIATNMNQRRREFAMLQSLGMTGREFQAMLNFECGIYGGKGIIYGLFCSVFVTVPMYLYSNEGSLDGYFIPWRYAVFAVICVFLVVFAAMCYGKSRVKKADLMGTLKDG